MGGLYHADDLRANHVRRLLGREVPTPEIEPILAWPNGRPWEPGRWSYGGLGTTARWIPSKDPQPPEVRLSMEAAEAAAVAASLDEAEVARKMLMWGAQEGPLQATRAEATRASGAVVAAPGNANIGDILEHKRRVWRLLRDEVTTPRIARADRGGRGGGGAAARGGCDWRARGTKLARRIAASVTVSELRAKYDRVGALDAAGGGGGGRDGGGGGGGGDRGGEEGGLDGGGRPRAREAVASARAGPGVEMGRRRRTNNPV